MSAKWFSFWRISTADPQLGVHLWTILDTSVSHRALPQPEDGGRGHCRRLLRHSARSATRHVQCSENLCNSSAALSRSEQHGSAAHLSSHCHRSPNVCHQRMVRFHQSIWLLTHQLSDWSSPVLYLVWQCYTYSQYKVQNHAGSIIRRNTNSAFSPLFGDE